MIFKCTNCGLYFSDGVVDDSLTNVLACPECGSEYLEEKTESEVCEDLEYWKACYYA